MAASRRSDAIAYAKPRAFRGIDYRLHAYRAGGQPLCVRVRVGAQGEKALPGDLGRRVALS